ncbi:GMC family oxidoreductase [Mesorhizobium sp. M4B.F.Ca.ET.017.02.2.1]|uniref:GMC oxidoreductase n=1 Tax=Mesorhizobium sp. M4B.F.Ca.ET.017.02.2.1 TaxID=2496649 RepID=UPI000FC9E7C4|nr:GMC family oxidoreductase [Mesorhizobium sp. M4B.F.Ca.ET.017.02.2.1]RVD31776.1 GMC family oxidoreductase [Mesorhizobium sp. M4B.F.Ca.ET.017.02.2.1]
MASGTPDISDRVYDVVVVGSGVTGTVLAKVLAELAYRERKSLSILILEAGTGIAGGDVAHNAYLNTYYGALIKTPNAPYPISANAPSPEDLAFLKAPNDRYIIQNGPLTFGSNNLRMLGGTTHHWMGISLRMLPADFELKKRHGVGVNWPISYSDMRPFYEKAEWELGISACAADQYKVYPGAEEDFGDYEYPMQRIPVSYLDQVLEDKIGADFTFEMEGEEYPVRLVPIPQARNSIPQPAARDPRDYIAVSRHRRDRYYQPSGAPEDLYTGAGQRCEGNSSCIPICPSRAKYNALKTIEELGQLAKLAGIHVDIVTRAVASEVLLGNDGNVSAIEYLAYDEPNVPYTTTCRAKGRRFVLAASAIENAKLLLASRDNNTGKAVANSSACVGRNLMDHPFILSWGLMSSDDAVDGFRGPLVTSDLPMREGNFRGEHAAFRTDVGNTGWSLADTAPYLDLERMIDPSSYRDKYPKDKVDQIVPNAPLSGTELRTQLGMQLRRQITLGFLMEQLPDPKNYVTIDPQHRDPLGLHKPVIHYDIDSYTRSGMAAAYRFASKFYERVGAVEFTDHDSLLGDKVKVGNRTFKYIGAGHIMGTHRMGSSAADSVVNSYQQSWDHPNLYVIGCGSMPTVGTSNPTLTATALSIRSAEHLFDNLELAGR